MGNRKGLVQVLKAGGTTWWQVVSYCQEDFLPPRPILTCRLASLLLQAPCRIRGTYRRPLLGTSSGLPGGRLGMCPENMIKCTRASQCRVPRLFPFA